MNGRLVAGDLSRTDADSSLALWSSGVWPWTVGWASTGSNTQIQIHKYKYTDTNWGATHKHKLRFWCLTLDSWMSISRVWVGQGQLRQIGPNWVSRPDWAPWWTPEGLLGLMGIIYKAAAALFPTDFVRHRTTFLGSPSNKGNLKNYIISTYTPESSST